MELIKIILASTLLLTAACSNEPTLDCTTKEKCSASLKLVTASLTPDEKERFTKKLATYKINRLNEIMKKQNFGLAEMGKAADIVNAQFNGLSLDDLQELIKNSKEFNFGN